MSSTPPSSLRSTIAAIIPCIVWSSAVLVAHRLSLPFGPLRAAGIEYGISGLFLFLISFLQGNTPRMWAHSTQCLFWCGTLWFLNVALFWLAIAATNSSGELLVTGLLNYLWPAFTLLLSIPILGKKPNKLLSLGLAATLIGIVLAKIGTSPADTAIDAFTRINPGAYSLATFAAIAWGVYSNLARKLSNPNGGSSVAIYMVLTSLILLVSSSLISEPYRANLSDWILIVSYSSASAAAYLFWDIGMRYGNVVVISTISMLIPLASTIITAIASGHGITLTLISAAALVVLGSGVCRRGVE